ncbi:hypothetical protein F4782DRAFT_477156 [Xylaria castorea]|nr:hypothetical protein F4782DRAFT_477156 [Xylaria castorea]
MLTSVGNQASNSSTSVPPTSIRKKRIACDNCHLSKVRCTGEISGCQRCERGNKSCHYSESNMGRMPSGGVRKRLKPSPHEVLDVFGVVHPQQRQHHDWDSASPFESIDSSELQDDQQHAPPSTASRGRESLDLPVDDSMSIWDEPNGPSQQQQQFKSLLDSTGSELDSLGLNPLTSTLEDIDFSDMDDGHFEAGECPLDLAFPRLAVAQSSRSSSIASQKHIQPQQQQSQLQLQMTQLFNTSSSSSTSQNYQDSNCELNQRTGTPSSSTDSIRYWTTQLEKLSRTLQKPPIPLDGMLHHSSQLLPRIREALQSPYSSDTSSSAARLILILVCLTQIVTLFEQCVPSVLAGRSIAGSSDLSLRLGEFQVDRKAQQALQMHIVGKELSSMMQLSKMIRQTLLRPGWCNISKRTHDLLLEDLQIRTVTLVYQMKQKRSASIISIS